MQFKYILAAQFLICINLLGVSLKTNGIISFPLDYLQNPKNPTPPKLRLPPSVPPYQVGDERGDRGVSGEVQ
ncbi:hypothetical protein NIES4103_12120 [Nostoc sp. NIES-4103]|nr:hypothetical protein NIES4103_12120 [Nostoc sp. NIES-4103]